MTNTTFKMTSPFLCITGTWCSKLIQRQTGMTSPGDSLVMPDLRPHPRPRESEFLFLCVLQVIHMYIKVWETLSWHISSHWPSDTNSEKYISLVTLIFCPEHIKHMTVCWYARHNDCGTEPIMFLLWCRALVMFPFVPFNNCWRSFWEFYLKFYLKWEILPSDCFLLVFLENMYCLSRLSSSSNNCICPCFNWMT